MVARPLDVLLRSHEGEGRKNSHKQHRCHWLLLDPLNGFGAVVMDVIKKS